MDLSRRSLEDHLIYFTLYYITHRRSGAGESPDCGGPTRRPPFWTRLFFVHGMFVDFGMTHGELKVYQRQFIESLRINQ
jgi:hypothetical protein